MLTTVQALEMLAECFGTEAAALTPGHRRDAIPGWDSMGALMLMAELDARFGIELDPESSRAMVSVEDALVFLRRRGVLAG